MHNSNRKVYLGGWKQVSTESNWPESQDPKLLARGRQFWGLCYAAQRQAINSKLTSSLDI